MVSELTPPFKYVMEGRVVTMGPEGVLPDGAVFIEDGIISAVQSAKAPTPPGFKGVTRIRTGDTLYPGLIELHNHLAYNAVPLWLVPIRYANNGQWRGTRAYRRHVTAPAKVLGNTKGLVEAVIRFVECRSLLGGTTTSQGITLVNVNIKSFFHGLVRNVEMPAIPKLPAAATRIANPPTQENEKQGYLERQKRTECYLQHLSEGIDATARGWFLNLRRTDGTWAIHNSFCGIHSTALTREDFDIIVERKGSMVWSPLSNYLLYGDTVNVRAVADSGIKVALGSDWAPSGSKNLLGELKVAWLASEEAGGVFSAEDLVRMATINAAEILGWDAALGTIQPGKRADIIAINGKTDDPFEQLIKARETSITLVVIDGIPRVGQPRLMNRFQLETPEELQIGSAKRILHLAQDDVHPLVKNLTLGEATQRLEDALMRLPKLASAVDNALLTGLGADSDMAPLSTVRLDLELDDEPLEVMAGSLADDVFAMKLEAITVADDPTFLPKMMAALNLPEFIKEGLPGLYGKSRPAPFEAAEQRLMVSGLPVRVNATVQTLRQFLDFQWRLTLEQRKQVVDQALLILEQNYVHLPFKRSMHGIDPVQRLRLLRYQLDQLTEQALPPDIEFHAEVTRIFHSLRDLHTTYRLPYPYQGVVAWLPFFVEEYWDEEKQRYRYIISKIAGQKGADQLEGTEILYWNGIPIEKAIAANAYLQAGSNPDARRARGLNSLTIRPLGRGLPPDEDWVTVHYRDSDGVIQESRQDWLVFIPDPMFTKPDFDGAKTLAASTLGIDDHTDDIQTAKKVLYASDVWQRERKSEPGERIQNAADALKTSMATVFRARTVKANGVEYGHVRIFTFNVARADEFVEELGRLVQLLPETGLLLDVRGNGGGLIPAAEGALQLFTSRRIEPQRAQFINTPLNLALCRMYPDDADDIVQLGRWVASVQEAVQTGATFSLGFPITSPDFLNSIAQCYFGPVALITDALCYSATDMFAAGFQDHEIGPIVGTHNNTGAGGANVWSHGLLRRLWRPGVAEASPYIQLPDGAGFHVAMRRTLRVGLRAGGVVEDLGIPPDVRHYLTQRDLMENNQDLINTVAHALSEWDNKRAHISVESQENGALRGVVSAPEGGADEVTLSFHIRSAINFKDGSTSQEIYLTSLSDMLHGATVGVEVQGVTTSGKPFSCYTSVRKTPE